MTCLFPLPNSLAPRGFGHAYGAPSLIILRKGPSQSRTMVFFPDGASYQHFLSSSLCRSMLEKLCFRQEQLRGLGNSSSTQTPCLLPSVGGKEAMFKGWFSENSRASITLHQSSLVGGRFLSGRGKMRGLGVTVPNPHPTHKTRVSLLGKLASVWASSTRIVVQSFA